MYLNCVVEDFSGVIFRGIGVEGVLYSIQPLETTCLNMALYYDSSKM